MPPPHKNNSPGSMLQTIFAGNWQPGSGRERGGEAGAVILQRQPSRALGRLDGAGRIRQDNLVAFVKPSLRGSRSLWPGSGKSKSGGDGHLDDLLFEEIRQVVGRFCLGDEFWR